jgi:glycosyltransferase involved in cell wall biosynthesis
MASLSHGLATLSTFTEISEPFWFDSGSLALVPAQDHVAFAERAEHLLNNPNELTSLRIRARSLYAEAFVLERTINLLRATTFA